MTRYWLIAVCLASGIAHAQLAPVPGPPPDHLSEQEIKAAIDAKPNTGYVFIEDKGFATPSQCQAQMPSEALYTPAGWLNALSQVSKQQYLPFVPNPKDTLRVLTVVSSGCASGTPSGPFCQSITRVALLSDVGGSAIAEAVSNVSLSSTWQNGYGASTACRELASKFSMEDVARVKNAKGEFIIATFSGPTLLKRYTVKQKHLKSLGMQ